MAKKKQPITRRRDGDEYLATGIFERVISRRRRSVHETNECMQREYGWMELSIEQNLKRIRSDLRPLLEPFIEKIDDIEREFVLLAPAWRVVLPLCAFQPLKVEFVGDLDLANVSPTDDVRVLDLGEGIYCYRISSKLSENSLSSETARDALIAFYEMNDISESIGKSYQALFVATLELGRLLERISVRPFEHAAEVGRNIKLSNSVKAKMSADGRAEMYRSDAKTYQQEVESLMSTGLKYTPATEEIARVHNVSGKHVRNHTTNPSPSNKGGRKKLK